MKSFKFFDTLENTLVAFKPLNPKQVLLYTCGPTVYNYAHIGNLRTYMFEDILKRSLLYFGYGVKHVMNITDIDDKTIKGALEQKVSLKEFTQKYTKAFFEDLDALQIIKADVLPKATDYIAQMITMIQHLVDNKHAYIGPDGSVYFALSTFPSYGKLSHLEKKSLVVGASTRVIADEYDKENPSDFVLWKAYDKQRDGDIYWESCFGKGRPGWHIECSAMASSILGKTIDIHCGGIDNMFPHHENEIAQCEACYNLPFSKYWLHSQHLLVEGKKMSKSLGNFFTLRDLTAKGYTARAIRYVLLSGHYKMPLNFTFEGLDAAKGALARIDSVIDRLQTPTHEMADKTLDLTSYTTSFENALLDDLNTPQALSALFDMIRAVNTFIDKQGLSKTQGHHILETFKNFDKVFSFIFYKEETIPDFILALAEKRKEAKKAKNFQESDRLREEIKELGFSIEDTSSGFRVTKL